MANRSRWSDAKIRKAAAIAKEFGVSITLAMEGAVTISPRSAKDIEEDELDRELDELERGFLNPWPGPHLNHREKKVLQTLTDAKGQPLPASGIAFAGPATVNSLLAHGLVAFVGDAKSFDRSMDIYATTDGLTFLKRRADHYRKFPSF